MSKAGRITNLYGVQNARFPGHGTPLHPNSTIPQLVFSWPGELPDAARQSGSQIRQQIGQELHDTLGQDLSALKLLCSALTQKAAQHQPINATDLAIVEDQLNATLSHWRNIARGLCSGENRTHEPLAVALEKMAARFQMLHVSCSITGPAFTLPEPIERELYHIAQEAATNALKHGRARHIWIEFGSDDNHIFLKISNDGAPFTAQPANPDGLGLTIMHRRAQVIGAELFIRTEPGGNPSVVCLLPNPHPQICTTHDNTEQQLHSTKTGLPGG